ncbi:EF-hand domain-containing protein [Pelagicoccus sp. SDUM812005]|uniref:EF-hand domain-containing protein n=1 Tax=Pelagicoccus sp. SDUM812005 TaxID=3041257 RepID=UPI0028108B58|nr:EF-hand domain-containing protein [Pelagicoccus sp. SDUM812005]MDQ8180759.1 EF-hand domain-containing protein [Pelagicoccus sp. SDUM812005]
MIQNVQGTYSGQFTKQLLEARRESVGKGVVFDPMAFSSLLPAEEGEAGAKPVEAGSGAGGGYAMDFLGDEGVLSQFRSFDRNRDGRYGFDEHLRSLEAARESEGLNTSSGISLDDFGEFVANELEFDFSKEMLEIVFEKFDLDGNGVLDPKELESAIEHLVEQAERKEEKKTELKKDLRREVLVDSGRFLRSDRPLARET